MTFGTGSDEVKLLIVKINVVSNLDGFWRVIKPLRIDKLI
jgi:hypothetical protein